MPKNAPKTKTLVDSLDALIEKHHLLKHPFYQAWTAGKLSKDSLALYAEQYYQHVRAFPENLKQLAARTNGDAALNALVNENLAEELDSKSPPPILWRQFAQSVGVSKPSIEGTHPLPAGHCRAAGYFRRTSRGAV